MTDEIIKKDKKKPGLKYNQKKKPEKKRQEQQKKGKFARNDRFNKNRGITVGFFFSNYYVANNFFFSPCQVYMAKVFILHCSNNSLTRRIKVSLIYHRLLLLIKQ